MDDAFQRISQDAGLRAVLKTARVWGVSPRRFLGWEPTRTIGHVWENARIVRTVETVESEWDDETRDLVMAFAMWEADLCPGCQQPWAETTLPEREGFYVPGAAIRCHRCTASQVGAEVYQDVPQAQALYIPVTLRGGSDAG